VSFLVAGGAVVEFVYLEKKETEKIQVTQQLIEYNNALKKEDIIKDIEKIRALTYKIGIAKKLLNKHIASSGILAFLEVTTPQRVGFSNFSFQKSQEKTEDTVKLTMSGQATSYEVLAALSQFYKHEPLLKSYSLTNFSLNDQGGVSFSFSGIFRPEVISYAQQIRGSQEINTIQPESDEIKNESAEDKEDGYDKSNEQL